jgi:hypothetical protein
MKFKLQTVSAISFALALGSISVAQADGGVGAAPVKQRKHHKPQKHHVPHCPPKHVHHHHCPVVPEGPCFKSGFYAGLQGGYSLMHGKYNNDYFDAISVSTLNKTLWNSGIVGEILFGGRYLWENCVITGVEVSALVDSNRLRHNFLHPATFLPNEIVPFSSQVRRQYAFIPSVVLGYQFCKRWHAFLKLGASFSYFKIREDNLNDRITFKHRTRKTTFIPQIGLEYALNCDLSFQGSFAYEHFSRVGKQFQPVLPETAPAVAGNFYNARVKRPQYFTLKFGMLVKI